MKLVIVDTPAQAKHVADTLGENWQVEACMGGVRDLPSDKLGIDMLHDFQPSYTLLHRKGNLVRRLMRAIASAEAIYVAMPPGRKSEMMAWHILALAPTLQDKPVYCMPLIALTPEAIRSAFASPRELNSNGVEAEISRRMVDQLITFLVSPLANQALNTNMTISRAALVCLGILMAHERTLQRLEPEKAWTLKARFVADSNEFEASLYSPQGKKFHFKSREQADTLATLLTNAAIWVDKTGSRSIDIDAPRPFTPMTLLTEAEARLNIEPAKTLELVHTLYEAGWLIYPTTEAEALAPQWINRAAGFIQKAFGPEYATSRDDLTDGSFQPAYLYPSEIDRLPEQLPGDGAALYSLIWHRFVASLMSAAQARQTAARILVGTALGKPFPLEFRAQAQQVLFDGWHRASPNELETDTDTDLPHLADGATIALKGVEIEAALAAPSRMTTSGLLAALDIQTMDRMEEYAAAIQSLIGSGNVELADGELIPTEQGMALAAFVDAHFGNVFSINRAFELEREFDQVAAGEVLRLDLLRTFWAKFGPLVTEAAQVILNDEPERPNRISERHRPIVLRPLAEG